MPPLVEPRMRGVILTDQIAQIEQLYGAEVIEAALGRLTPAQAEEIRATVSVSWLDVTTVTAFKTAIAEELGRDPLEFQREVVRAAIGETIHKMWRVLLRQLWDSAIVKRTPILYSKTFDRGEMTLERIEGSTAEFVLTGWPDIPEYDCVGLSTGMEALLSYAGRKNAKVTWTREPPKVRFHAAWSAR